MKLEFDILSSDTNSKVYNTLIIKNCAYQKPQIRVLIDTGAFLPTWVGGESAFRKFFPDSSFESAQAILRGFGKGYEVAPVYKIPKLELRDRNENSVAIRDVYVVVTKRDFSFQMILSFTALRKMNYQYVSYVEKGGISQEISPKFKLEPYRDTYYMSANFIDVNRQVLEELGKDYPHICEQINQPKILYHVYTFAQD